MQPTVSAKKPSHSILKLFSFSICWLWAACRPSLGQNWSSYIQLLLCNQSSQDNKSFRFWRPWMRVPHALILSRVFISYPRLFICILAEFSFLRKQDQTLSQKNVTITQNHKSAKWNYILTYTLVWCVTPPMHAKVIECVIYIMCCKLPSN